MLEQVLKEDPVLMQVVKDCNPWEGPHTEAREKSLEDGAAERNCYELTTNSIPHPRSITQEGEKVESGMRE